MQTHVEVEGRGGENKVNVRWAGRNGSPKSIELIR